MGYTVKQFFQGKMQFPLLKKQQTTFSTPLMTEEHVTGSK